MTARIPPPDAPGALRPLGVEHWPAAIYDRAALPERVLQFGTGMLLRALVDTAVDAANRDGAFAGRIAVVQSTPHGCADGINRQAGLFTLLERGLEDGKPTERTRLVGSLSRGVIAEEEWPAVRDLAATPALQVIVSNVTEAGFRLGRRDLERPGGRMSFPAKLVDLLHTRFERLPAGPLVYVIPTELIPDNGPELLGLVDRLARLFPDARAFRTWLAERVRFCSSLVDRITTGAPDPELQSQLESRLGYTDALCTVTEPHALWAIEADPGELRAAFPIDTAPGVIVAPDIGFYRERKLKLLNGAHSATAPLALLAGVATVRDAVEHQHLGLFLRRILFDEIAPGTDLPADAANAYARTVMDRFRNPWLAHSWQVIATNQAAKFQIRVVPSIVSFMTKRRSIPQGLALSFAAHLRFLRTSGDPAGAREADAVLSNTGLTGLPGFMDAVTSWQRRLERDGVNAALIARAHSGTP